MNTRKVLLVLAFAVAALLGRAAGYGAPALGIPRLTSRVTDLAGVLSADQVQSLETKVADLERTDSTQIAILIIPSLEGEPLEDYSIHVAEAWRLGQKGRDNGALLIVAMKERRVRIEVGYGLEPTLTDARSSQIIRNEIIPRFRDGDFYGGIDAGTTAIVQVVRGLYQAPPEPRRTSSGRFRLDWIILLLFPVLPILSWTGKWGGAVLGTGAGALLPYFLFGAGLTPLLVGAVLGGAAGAVLGGLIQTGSRSQHGRHDAGGPFWPGGRGFGGGFGGGGGGFSGGGGGFGGGGSSGSW
jgi:uncharacterized protein